MLPTLAQWRASDHCAAGVRCEEVFPGVVCALARGEGMHLRPKGQANEDSLGVLKLPQGVLALVADAHHGAGAGERLLQHLFSLAQQAPPTTLAALQELVLAADEKATRWARDSSQSTLLVVRMLDQQVDYVSVGDSLLLHGHAGALSQRTLPIRNYAGGTLPLRALLAHPSAHGATLWESGSFALSPGDRVILATDGIEEDCSGLSPQQLASGLLTPTEPLEALRALAQQAAAKPRGGGDNLALVLLQPS